MEVLFYSGQCLEQRVGVERDEDPSHEVQIRRHDGDPFRVQSAAVHALEHRHKESLRGLKRILVNNASWLAGLACR